MAELADAADSKSVGPSNPCGFDSHLRHHFISRGITAFDGGTRVPPFLCFRQLYHGVKLENELVEGLEILMPELLSHQYYSRSFLILANSSASISPRAYLFFNISSGLSVVGVLLYPTVRKRR